MKLSVVIPAFNEEGCIVDTVRQLATRLVDEDIEHEILGVNDSSEDEPKSCYRCCRRRLAHSAM